ncbi:MAG: hypothetical protein KKA64_04245 [Nanoarchaeota archaeon]|nr:hypothetical protein [Nanoarchaeota archaeon]
MAKKEYKLDDYHQDNAILEHNNALNSNVQGQIDLLRDIYGIERLKTPNGPEDIEMCKPQQIYRVLKDRIDTARKRREAFDEGKLVLIVAPTSVVKEPERQERQLNLGDILDKTKPRYCG